MDKFDTECKIKDDDVSKNHKIYSDKSEDINEG